MTILNEQGAPEVLPPLRTAGDLAKRLPGALVIVVGTISEAHLLRPLASPFASPDPGYGQRLASLVLDPDEPPQQGQIATRVIGAAAGQRGTELVLLVAGRSARLLGVDADFEARLVARRLDLPVEVVDPDEPYVVPGVLSTDLWDRTLAALVNVCPKRRTSDLLETAPAKRGQPPGEPPRQERRGHPGGSGPPRGAAGRTGLPGGHTGGDPGADPGAGRGGGGRSGNVIGDVAGRGRRLGGRGDGR